jgi:hypothetical protein
MSGASGNMSLSWSTISSSSLFLALESFIEASLLHNHKETNLKGGAQ